MLPPPDEVTPFEDGALYDIILGSIDYGFDYYVNLVKAAKGPVLDVACGTGRILIPALQAGVDIEGVDLFQGMLTQLVKKTTALGLKPVLHHADMRSFRLDRRYALIVIPFNAIIHSLNTAEQLATLETCRKHLLPGGSLVFDTFFPGRGIMIFANATDAYSTDYNGYRPNHDVRDQFRWLGPKSGQRHYEPKSEDWKTFQSLAELSAATGQETLTLKGHTNVVRSVSFSPDGKRIVSGSFDATIKVWDASMSAGPGR